MNRPRIASLWVVLVASACSLFGQDPPRGSFSDAMDVSVVNVDVLVTDRQGSPVRGLTEKDFQILVDKKKTKLTNFYVGTGDESSPGERLSLIVFVDSFNLRPGNREPALSALKPFLAKEMARGIPVMVASYGGEIQVHQDLTTDVAKIETALSDLQGDEARPSQAEAFTRSTSSSVDEALRLLGGSSRDQRLGSAALDGLLSQLRGYAEAIADDVNATTDSLIAFANGLAAIPGRKAVVYVSDGLAMRPLDEVMLTLQTRLRGGGGGDLVQSPGGLGQEPAGDPGGGGDGLAGAASGISGDASFGRSTDMEISRLAQVVEPFNTTDKFQQLAALANTNRVTFYTIKAPPGDASGADLVDTAKGSSSQGISDLRESLELMASSTGGLALLTGTDVAGFLERARSDFGAYYVLGFAAKDKGEGTFHSVDVRIKGRGQRYRHRQSYISKNFLTRLADRTMGALVMGFTENLHEVSMEIDSQAQGADGNYDVSVVVTFPIGSLDLIQEQGLHLAQAKMAVALMNSLGHVPPVQHMEVPLKIPDADLEQAKQQLFGARVNLRMPVGQQRLAIGLWDEAAGKGSFVTEDLTIGTSGGN